MPKHLPIGIVFAACLAAIPTQAPAQAIQSGTSAAADAGCTCRSVSAPENYTGADSASATASYASTGTAPLGAASASSSADLVDASLHAFAMSSGAAAGAASAGWFDTLTFDLGGADPSGFTPITILYTFEGSQSFDQAAALNTLASVGLGGALGAPAASFLMLLSKPSTDLTPTFQVSDGGNNSLVLNTTQIASGSWLTTATWNMPNHIGSVFITSQLSVISAGNATNDFSNTASLDLKLPPGVTFTSASGKFLTATPPSVPEPSTWAMMIGGFGAVGFAMRRRRKPAGRIAYQNTIRGESHA